MALALDKFVKQLEESGIIDPGKLDVNDGRIVQRSAGPMVGRKVQRMACWLGLVRQS